MIGTLSSLKNTTRFCVFLAMPHGIWNLSSLTRDWTHAPCNRSVSLNHWTTREVLDFFNYYYCGKTHIKLTIFQVYISAMFKRTFFTLLCNQSSELLLFRLRWVLVALLGLSLVAASGTTLCCGTGALGVWVQWLHAALGLSSCGARA